MPEISEAELDEVILFHEDHASPFDRRFRNTVQKLPAHHRLALAQSLRHRMAVRDQFAEKYLTGVGIEIGAQFWPTKVSERTEVEYVDALSNEDLSTRYKLPIEQLVPLTHVVDDLSVYEDESRDFIIAHHVLEHFDNPVAGILQWLRVVKPGGSMFEWKLH